MRQVHERGKSYSENLSGKAQALSQRLNMGKPLQTHPWRNPIKQILQVSFRSTVYVRTLAAGKACLFGDVLAFLFKSSMPLCIIAKLALLDFFFSPTSGWSKGQTYDTSSREAAWRRMVPLLLCGGDRMKFRVAGRGVSELAVDQGKQAGLFLFFFLFFVKCPFGCIVM